MRIHARYPATPALLTAAVVVASVALTGPASAEPSPTVVISQVYGGGGNSGATLTHDFIELFNRGDVPVDLSSMTVQYASAAGSFANIATQIGELSGTIQPGQYVVIKEASTNVAVGAPFTADIDDPTPIAMSGSSGKVALVDQTTGLGCGATGTTPVPCTANQLMHIVDLVGYGTSATLFEGTGPSTPSLTSSTATARKSAGCVDTATTPATSRSSRQLLETVRPRCMTAGPTWRRR